MKNELIIYQAGEATVVKNATVQIEDELLNVISEML